MKLLDLFKKKDKRTAKRKIGDLGEDIAVKYLEDNLYIIRERNWRFGRNEIDIIAQKNFEIAFIEVKTAANESGWDNRLPSSAVTREKQKNIIDAARVYMGGVFAYIDKSHSDDEDLPWREYPDSRFDVIEVYLNNGTPKINHIENAFYVEKGNKRKWKT